MTINDIENTLKSLVVRHPNLEEGMLITLLTAGGWEEKNIRDARLIFRNTNNGKRKPELSPLLIPLEGKTALPEIMDTTHSLLEHNPEVFTQGMPSQEKESVSIEVKPKTKIKETEIQSLTEHTFTTNKSLNPSVKLELPDNLPLRPFESTPHVWPLSLYKNVFHAEEISVSDIDQKEIKDKNLNTHGVKNSNSKPIKNKIDSLFYLAGAMLLVIIVLLIYVYSYGRP